MSSFITFVNFLIVIAKLLATTAMFIVILLLKLLTLIRNYLVVIDTGWQTASLLLDLFDVHYVIYQFRDFLHTVAAEYTKKLIK